jgi:hypothetical protein
VNVRHPSGDPHPPAPDARHASYASYDQQRVQYGDGYPSYDGYDAYATGSVATATAAFSSGGGYATDQGYPATGGFPAAGLATGGLTPGAIAGTGDHGTDPHFGNLPRSAPATDRLATGAGSRTGQWTDTTTHPYDPYGAQPQTQPLAQPHTEYGTGGHTTGGYPATGYDTGTRWDATAWAGPGQADTGQWDTTSSPPVTHHPYGHQGFDPTTGYDPAGHHPDGYGSAGYETTGYDSADSTPQGCATQTSVCFETTASEQRGQPDINSDSLDSAPYEPVLHGELDPELADYEHQLADIDATGFSDSHPGYAESGHASYADGPDSDSDHAPDAHEDGGGVSHGGYDDEEAHPDRAAACWPWPCRRCAS